MAVVAKATSKPFYVVAECFKFVREYPLTQWDVRNPDKVRWMCVVSVSLLHVCVRVCAHICTCTCIWAYLVLMCVLVHTWLPSIDSCYSQLNFIV